MTATTDFVIVGAGIIGLATARAVLLAKPDLRVCVLEKEPDIGRHQTGRNSGVIHSGIYYQPGSLKAEMCRRGNATMSRYAEEHGVPFEMCGKLIVATAEAQRSRLRALHERGLANGLPVTMLRGEEASAYEPHVRAIEAVHVASTGIIDYGAVCRAIRDEILERGGVIHLDARVTAVRSVGANVRVTTTSVEVEARALVNCAGLYSDVVAKLAGARPTERILPFRGEYFHLAATRTHLVRNLVYPVPDPELPFLGVHFTRSIHGGVHAGPNAVLAFAREGYNWRTVRPRELWWTAGYGGSWKLGRRYWRTGIDEVLRSLSRRRFLRSLQALIPEIELADLVPAESGVRAQAVTRAGRLVDDFSISTKGRTVNVLNAPSPAATSALAIGEHVAAHAIAAAGS